MKRILIASANPWSFSMAVEQDIAYASHGCRVDLLNLFKLCSSLSPHWRPIDRLAETINRKIERFVRPAITGKDITGVIRPNFCIIPPAPLDPKELRSYTCGNARIGLSVLSSITSVTTIQNPSDTSEYGAAFPLAWRSAHISQQVGEAVRKLGYDEIYIFNGRHCYSRPFCDVLEKNTRVFRYEQGANGTRYIQSDEGVHNPKAIAKLIEAHDFDAADGEAFYTERLNKAPGNPVQFFTAKQTKGLIPPEVEKQKTVSLFTSSSDEFYAISDRLGYGEFANQFEIAATLSQICKSTGKLFVVRFHPHLKYKHPSWQREWDFDFLRSNGAILLGPDDPCDTYTLLSKSESVFTVGSTVGFECSYLSVPCAEVGGLIAGTIGAVTLVNTGEEAAQFVRAPSLPAGARNQAIRFGSYLKRAGKPLPKLSPGDHPYYARLEGRIVDPVRYVYQKVRSIYSGNNYAALPPGGKIAVEPSVLSSLARDLS